MQEQRLIEACRLVLRDPDPAALENYLARTLGMRGGDPPYLGQRAAIGRYARSLARLWSSSIPTPANAFRPKPHGEPPSRKPCLCGSQGRFADCCRPFFVLTPYDLGPEDFWPYALLEMSSTERAVAFASDAMPPRTPVKSAAVLIRQARFADVVVLLQPLLATTRSFPSLETHLICASLWDAYEKLGEEATRDRLIEQLLQGPRTLLRAQAWACVSRLALHKGQLPRAWEALRNAMADDPGDALLALDEMTLFADEGRAEEGRVIGYARLAEAELAGQWEAAGVLRPLLREATVSSSEPDIRARLQEFGQSSLRLLQSVELAVTRSLPRYFLVPTRARLRRLKGPRGQPALEKYWQRVFPHEVIAPENWPRTLDEVNASCGRVLAEQPANGWLSLLEQKPAALDSLTILDQLRCACLLVEPMGGARFEPAVIRPLLERACNIIIAALPARADSFQLDEPDANPLVMRILLSSILSLFVRNAMDEVLEMGAVVLQLDADNKHQLRAQLVYMHLYADQDVLAIEMVVRYGSGGSPQVVLAEILALWRLGRADEAALRVWGMNQAAAESAEFIAWAVAVTDLFELGPPPPVPLYLSLIFQPQLLGRGYRDVLRREWQRSAGALQWLRTATTVGNSRH